MTSVTFLDLRMTYLEISDELDAACRRVLDSGRYLLGPELAAFEADFAAYVQAAACVAVGSGYDALVLALRAIGIRPGDEVVVPANTYVATWLAVSAVGAVPIPVEPDESFGIDPSRIEDAITPRTRALLPVHLYGQPVDLDSIYGLAAQYGLRVVEDAAQAHGASYRGRRVGSSPDAVAWSFYPSKNLGAFGDGGAVTTNDERVADTVRVLRNYGSRVKDFNEERGVNSRLDELQAAMLRVKLRQLDEWNDRRHRIASFYRSECATIMDLRLPALLPATRHAWHLFVIRTMERDALRDHLYRCGIETSVHYPIPPYRQEAYSDLRIPAGAFRLTDQLHEQVLSLPMGPHMSLEDAARVTDALRSFSVGNSHNGP